jgi:hypothetical protein
MAHVTFHKAVNSCKADLIIEDSYSIANSSSYWVTPPALPEH